MRKKNNPTPNDIAMFQQAIKGTKPLIHNKASLTPSKKKPAITHPSPPLPPSLQVQLLEDVPPVTSEEFLTYKHSSIPHKTLRNLRKGQYNVEATLDMHGMSVEDAKMAVENFLFDCIEQDIRVALIIHGKGRHSEVPILKNHLNQWLRTIDAVLAFCSATPNHGSRGAVYVLLKRNSEEKFT